MDIDLVYCYVNGDDEEWYKKRREYLGDKSDSCRFRDNHELKYSLRSVEKYAPWIRKIFIVVDSALPDWLEVSNDKLVIVRHEEIMPKEILPCYNSNVIENFLDRIPGLSECFIYANDDMLFCNKVTPDFFFSNGMPVVRMKKQKFKPNNYYFTVLHNSQQLIRREYGEVLWYSPSHNVDAYSKEGIRECNEKFREELENASRHRTRTMDDIHRVLYHYYLIVNKKCVFKGYEGLSGRKSEFIKQFLFPSKYLDFIAYSMDFFFASRYTRLLFSRKPKMVCINDGEGTTDQDIQKYQKLMNAKFPKKSSFEKIP